LYVLRNDLGLSSPQFGCGLSQCGACSVLVDGKEARSCVLPVSTLAGKQITTLEGLPDRWATQKGLPPAAAKETLHPVQQAWIDTQVPQCGFCQNGMMITATALLEQTPSPTVEQIKAAYMSGPSPHLCRCGTYSAIVEAVQKASTLVAKAR
jgi:aerobic-type carbon monoxide dehydrogenase small subunit (CoxS/CutS family)